MKCHSIVIFLSSRWWVRAAPLLALAAAGCGDSPVAPAACGPIPDVTVLVGETASVRACFNDANGDALNYTATSSNSSVATASVAGTTITVRAFSPGRAAITIVASDPGGLQAQQNVQVVVPNRAPEPRGTLPDITVQVGESSMVDVAQSFSDPDGETLTYRASSSDAAVARVTVSGSTVTVLAQIKGSTTVTVTASDPGGLSATQSFQMTVPNRPPAPVGAIGAQTIEVGRSVTVDVAGHFSDPDGDPLTYTAVSETVAVAGTSVSGSIVTITAARSGTTTITITASDPEGLSATQQVAVTVPNRPPSTVGSVPAQTVEVGRSATVNVSQYFSDPDGDALAYSATSSNTNVARASVSGSAVTITGVRAGSATITVTASDPEGLSASQQVAVTVPNRSPRRVGSIPGQTVEVGQSTTVELSPYFSDPDGDALTYSATSSNTDVAGASVLGSAVTITAVGAGSATITVTARDPEGLSATQQVAVTVPNRPPSTVGSVPAQTVEVGRSATVNVSQYFSDPDGDALAYSATSSNTNVARASVSGSAVTITGVRAGSATITVTACDPEGLSATQQVAVTVPNRPPRPVGSVPGQTVEVGQSTTVELSPYFSDPDGDALTYTASSTRTSVATASVSGRTVTVAGVAEGTATIRITATDPGGLSATQSFTVTVEVGDRAGLVALYEATDGPNWLDNTNWLTDAPLGDWYGVDTDMSGRVVRLVLTGQRDPDTEELVPHGLTGPIPVELGSLSELRVLDLGRNALTGSIPPALGNLAKLESLSLGENQLDGPIPPELGQLSSLRILYLYDNGLTGPIPPGSGRSVGLKTNRGGPVW